MWAGRGRGRVSALPPCALHDRTHHLSPASHTQWPRAHLPASPTPATAFPPLFSKEQPRVPRHPPGTPPPALCHPFPCSLLARGGSFPDFQPRFSPASRPPASPSGPIFMLPPGGDTCPVWTLDVRSGHSCPSSGTLTPPPPVSPVALTPWDMLRVSLLTVIPSGTDRDICLVCLSVHHCHPWLWTYSG